MDKFCNIRDVFSLVQSSTNQTIDPIYLNTIIQLAKNRQEKENLEEYWVGEDMNLAGFLILTNLLGKWYPIRVSDIAKFVDQKIKEKYAVTREDILGIISSAMEIKPTEDAKTNSEEKQTERRTKDAKPKKLAEDPDMYKIVQNALKKGMTKAEVMKKHKLTQRELTKYEGWKYWSESQRADHKAMLEYRRLHPTASNKETIEKGCGKDSAGYRFSLIPTPEEQEEYNRKFNEKSVPKAVIKDSDVKSLILSDEEKEAQQELYNKIKEIANARNVSPREVTIQFKNRLTRDYGIVIDQIKKDLMIKFRVNRGEGKAPNALEALVMSEYLPIAQSVLDTMLSESYVVK